MVREQQTLQLESQSDLVEAACAICAGVYQVDTEGNYREGALCPHCGSFGCSQSIAYALTYYVFRKDVALCNLKRQKHLKVVGLSDGPAYSKMLAEKCAYKNTYYHTKPFLDITKPRPQEFEKYDALISADVFEHVLAAPFHAFKDSYDILKSGGI